MYCGYSALAAICFANIFFQSVACLFSLLTVSFREKEFLILMRLNLLIFYFTNHIFDITSKKSLSNIVSQRFLLMFSSGCFIVLGFTFKSIIHFEILS